MDKLKVFDYKGREVRTVEQDGELWWVLKDVCDVLTLTHPEMVAKRLDRDEANQIGVIDSLGREQKTTVINEAGLYNVILRSDKPEAKDFKRWVTHEVLPSIRKHGAYVTARASLSYLKEKELEARINNSMARRAGTLLKIAEKVTVNEYRNVLYSKAAEIAGGQPLLPLPKVERHTYTAQEIGDKLGISANMVGRLANKNGLKTPEYGLLVWDKAKRADKQVESWRYYESIIPVLQEYMKVGA